MVLKRKTIYVILGALMMSGFAFGKLGVDSKIQEVKAEEKSIVWNFEDEEWQTYFQTLGDPGTDIATTWDVTVDGLNFYSTQRNRWNTTYIQLGGRGSLLERVFTFTANYAGTLEVTASNTGSSATTGRNICVQLEDDDKTLQEEEAGFSSRSPETVSFDIESGVQKIYPSSALRIYQIKYTYNDPTRTLNGIYLEGTANKLNYVAGDEFDPAGLKVMGKYSSGDDTEITTGIVWTFEPETLSKTDTSVKVKASVQDFSTEEKTVNNLTVIEVLTTVGEVLNTVSVPTEKANGWPSSDGSNVFYKYSEALVRFEDVNDSTTFYPVSLSNGVTFENGNYVCKISTEATITFVMKNDKLSQIDLVTSFRESTSGTYVVPHTLEKTHSEVSPTCIEPGCLEYYECDCGLYFSDEACTIEIEDLEAWKTGAGKIDPLGHSGTKQNGKPATCTEDGWKDYYKCDLCGKYFEDEDCLVEIEDLEAWKIGAGKLTSSGHDVSKQNGKPATCTEDGWKDYYKCDLCGKYFEDEDCLVEIEDLEAWKIGAGKIEGHHEPVKFEGKPATTSEAGWKDYYKCDLCGKYFEDEDCLVEIEDLEAWKIGAGMIEKLPEPGVQEEKGLSGGAVAGITIGAVAGVTLISYAVMFIVYAKSGKGLKFLFKSFDWFKKLFKMK